MFKLDSPFMEAAGKIADVVYVSFLWLLFSLPVITAGAAGSALYYTCVKVLRHKRGTITGAFRHSFRENWKTGCVLTAGYGVCFIFLYSCYRLLLSPAVHGKGLIAAAGMMILLPVLFTLPYVFALLSRFQASALRLLSYAVILSVRHIPSTLTLIALWGAAAVLMILIPALLILLPAAAALAASLLIERALRGHLPAAGDLQTQKDMPWYMEI